MSPQLKWFLLFAFSTGIITFLVIRYMPQQSDVIYLNGRFYTMNRENSVAEALAVRGGTIIGIGSRYYIERKFTAPKKIDLSGQCVLPGLIDAHCHLFGLGLARLTVDLEGAQSASEAAARVAERVKQSGPQQWVRGRGWDQNEWGERAFPRHDVLDRVAPDHPVYLVRVDGHACWVNACAMKIAGVKKQTIDPPGGRIIRDTKGEPTGIFIDAAMDLIYKFVPEPTEEEMREALRRAMEECLSFGLTSVQEMGIDDAQPELYKKMIDEGKFPLRVYAAIDGPGDLWDRSKKDGPLIGYGNNRLTVRAMKIYIDGALGSRGAALMEPYSDDPQDRGITLISGEELQKLVDEALRCGFQVCTHAIGDRANRIILNAYDAALKKNPFSDRRLRVEHAQVLSAEDIPRFKELGVLPSMQPVHCTSDMYWAEARLGSRRIRRAYAWRSLVNTGVIIPGGSDFPVESANPLLGIYAACSRQDVLGRPKDAGDVERFFQLSAEGVTDSAAFKGGWYPAEKMTLEEAVRCFTTWAAYAAFEENVKGSLERGKLADFIVLSDDIFEIPIGRIPALKVDRTIVGGKVAFTRK
jgi:predicted amidohydrolase YtcJ